MSLPKLTGTLLIIGAVALLIPYTILTITFDYPGILRQDTQLILKKFNAGGSGLILTWFSFAITGLPLIPAYLLMGKIYENRSTLIKTATTIGVVGLIAQMIGILRWTFVVPILAQTFANGTDEATKAAALVSFKTVHQYGGVLLGEHLGQLFTVTWTVMVSYAFDKLKIVPRWITLLGYISSIIYFLAQAELLATVIPGFPVWEMAGFLGSTLWLIWLIIIGIKFLKLKN